MHVIVIFFIVQLITKFKRLLQDSFIQNAFLENVFQYLVFRYLFCDYYNLYNPGVCQLF